MAHGTYGPGSHRGLSGNLWGNCNFLNNAMGGLYSPSGAPGDSGFFVVENFLNFAVGEAVSSNVATYIGDAGGYTSYEDTGSTVTQLSTTAGGVIEIATDATDNDECWLQGGYAASVLSAISNTSSSDYYKKTWFECRFAIDQIASGNFFIGLAEQGAAAEDFITDGDAMADDKDFIGFQQLAGDVDGLDVVYNKDSGTDVVVIDVAQTLVATTFYKAGFFFDPDAPASKKIKYFIDNTEQSTYTTATNMDDSTNFPGGEEMHFIAGVKNSTTTAKKLSVDWWAFAQEW